MDEQMDSPSVLLTKKWTQSNGWLPCRAMKPLFAFVLIGFFAFAPCIRSQAEPIKATVFIDGTNANGGRIDPKLFGNFIELLDDVAPGMWAEMLNDRSFEGVTKLSSWCYYTGEPDFCDREWDTNSTWNYDTENPFNGKRGVRLRSSSKQNASLTQSGLAVKKGMSYEFTGYFRADNARQRVTVSLKTQLPTGDWMTLASAKLPTLSDSWKKYSVRMKSKGETDRVVFEIRVEGQGSVWADKVSLMPADNLGGWRRDVVDAIRELRPGLVRFGGSVCDPGGYRWKNGIGDRDLRVPFPNKVWGRLDPNDVGIDEFCQFCELVGAEPLICLSFSDGPQNAADLVEYCNGDLHTMWGAKRAANGHPNPYHVKFWQIGNEISGDDENYVNRFGNFVELMKRNDPTIFILSSFPTQKLLNRAGAQIDYVAPHHYTADLGYCESDLANLTRMIAKTPDCERIKIAVTEWNTSGGDWGLMRGKQETLENGIINARYLNVLMRHSDKVKIACRSNMANSFCGAIIETSPGGLMKRPSYYVMQLYARHALPVPLKLEQAGDGPDLFACASDDGKSATIFVVNPKTQSVELSCRFDDPETSLRAVAAETVCDTEDARQTDVMNHWQAPTRIRTVPLPVSDDKIVLPALSATAIRCGVK